MRSNLLKDKLARGETVLGCVVQESRDPAVVHAVASGGGDFFVIDLEHVGLNLESVSNLINWAHAAGITPVVRVPEVTYGWITPLLDAGCQTIIAPRLGTGDQVRKLIEFTYYHPAGKRGVNMYGTAAVGYETVNNIAEAAAISNENMLLGLIVETAEAIENLDELLQPQIGFVLVGPYDLSQSFGIPGDFNDPRITEARRSVRAACVERGICHAAYIPSLDSIKVAISDEDVRMVLHGGIVDFVRQGVSAAARAIAGTSGNSQIA